MSSSTRRRLYYGADAGVIAARCGAALVIARKNASRASAALQELVGMLERQRRPSWPASIMNEF